MEPLKRVLEMAFVWATRSFSANVLVSAAKFILVREKLIKRKVVLIFEF